MIRRYVVAQTASGEIVRTVTCDEDSVAAQAGPGEVTIASDDAWPGTHYLVSGTLQAYTEAQTAAKTQRPDYPAQWDNTAMQWADQRTLGQMQADAWESLKAERAQRILRAGLTPVGVFDTDADGLANITSVSLALVVDPNIALVRFTCADNVRRAFSRNDFLAAAAAIKQAVQNIYDVADTLRIMVFAAASPDDLARIQWPT